jgi:hypothetical protein
MSRSPGINEKGDSLMELILDSSSEVIHDNWISHIIGAVVEQLFGDCLLEIFLAEKRPRCTVRAEETRRLIDEDTLEFAFHLDQCPQLLSQLLIPSGGMTN